MNENINSIWKRNGFTIIILIFIFSKVTEASYCADAYTEQGWLNELLIMKYKIVYFE